MRFQLIVIFAFALIVAAMASVSQKTPEKRDKRYIFPYGGYAAAYPYAAPYTYPYAYAPAAYNAYPTFAPYYGYPSPYFPYYG